MKRAHPRVVSDNAYPVSPDAEVWLDVYRVERPIFLVPPSWASRDILTVDVELVALVSGDIKLRPLGQLGLGEIVSELGVNISRAVPSAWPKPKRTTKRMIRLQHDKLLL